MRQEAVVVAATVMKLMQAVLPINMEAVMVVMVFVFSLTGHVMMFNLI